MRFYYLILLLIFNNLDLNAQVKKTYSLHKQQKDSTFKAQQPLHFSAAFLSTSIRPDTYNNKLGFFCRQEWKMEKMTGIALRFRLGSLDYVNKLEGK